MRRRAFFVLCLLVFHVGVYSAPPALAETENHDFTIGRNRRIRVAVCGTGTVAQKILRIYEKDGAGNWSERGSMETLRMDTGNYGEGFQSVYAEDGGIVVQQSFGDGKFLIISLLFFACEDGGIRLVRYAEERVDRFSADKDFSDIDYEIPGNIFFADVDSDFVYDLHSRGMRKCAARKSSVPHGEDFCHERKQVSAKCGSPPRVEVGLPQNEKYRRKKKRHAEVLRRANFRHHAKSSLGNR